MDGEMGPQQHHPQSGPAFQTVSMEGLEEAEQGEWNGQPGFLLVLALLPAPAGLASVFSAGEWVHLIKS